MKNRITERVFISEGCKKMRRILTRCCSIVLMLAMLSNFSAAASADSDWKSTAKEYFYNSEYDSAVAYLKPFAENDPEAKALRAAILSTAGNPEEDYRVIIAELIDDGEDFVPLLERVTKEVLGFVINLDLNGTMLHTYCEGDFDTAFSIAAYQARRGSVFGRSFLVYACMNCKDTAKEIKRLGITGDELEYWIEESCTAGDPVAMYLLAETNTYLERKGDVNYYEKAAELLRILEQGGRIPEPEGRDSEDDPDSLNLNPMSGLGFSVRNPLICFFIGECFRFGDGDFPKDLDQAGEWYRKAAEQGLPEGAENYGHTLLQKLLYRQVSGDDYDEVLNECYYYLQRAATTHGRPAAQYDLAALYYSIGDTDNGRLWMKTSAENGFSLAREYVDGSYSFKDWM